MTDRVQPGAIDSIIRNDELAQVFGQFSEGWIKPSTEPPSTAAVRRPEIDETALNGFALVSTSGFDITIDGGEGFVGGWCARDVTTTITVPGDTTGTVVLAWSLDAVFDPNVQSNRDLADEVRVDLAQNVDDQYPSTELFDVTADSNGITTTTDRRRLGASVVADNVEATGSITDPEGNTVTSLAAPVRVTEETTTFTESNVTVTNTNTKISNGSIELGVGNSLQTIDDFESNDLVVEDADWADWSGDISSLSAQQSTVISGSFSGEFEASNEEITTLIQRSPGIKASRVDVKIQIENATTSTGDRTEITLTDGSFSGSRVAQITFNDGGDIEAEGNDTGEDTQSNKTFTVSFRNIDYANSSYDVFLDGSQVLSNVSGFGSGVELKTIEIINRTDNSGETRSVYIDDIEVAEAPAKSGNALVEFDSGVPEDISAYDLISFQRTPDGETVTVDVEDGGGAVLFSDVGRNFDISSVDPSKNVKIRANLARSNNANDPTFDFAARRFIR
jgi:hypothetical protein